MEEFTQKRREILLKIEEKSLLKQRVYNKTLEVLQDLKEYMHEMTGEINDAITSARMIRIDYRDRGKFEAQIQVAGDILIFAMHTNIFTYGQECPLENNEYYRALPDNQYLGIINVYNFLADSFKYNRNSDEGYLIGRIFINSEKAFYIEGIEGTEYSYENYGKHFIDEATSIDIIESAILHAMNFDLYTPPFKEVRSVVVEQMNTRAENSNIKIAKRLGYDF